MSGCGACTSRRMRFAIVLAILAATICPDVSIGAGTPVPGYLGWTSLDSGGSTWYFYNDYGRFSFNNSTSKWYAYDQFSKQWQTLSSTGASGSYLFDGALHDMRNGWNYLYSTPLQTGNWARTDNGAARLGYDYSSGRWYQFDPYGGSWRTLSGSARSGYFLGNGALNDLGNGWKFVYSYSGDTGNWARSDTGAARFGYTYSSGQWWGYRTGWTRLGNLGNSSSFMGDGAFHTVSSTWAFSYNSSTDAGTWRNQSDGSDRFRYSFGAGQWYSTSAYDAGSWNAVGAAGVSSVFLGDGAWHGLNNGWSYVYNSAGDYALWRYGANQRFQYSYRDGQWFNTGAYDAGSWNAISGPDRSSSFVGDGVWHDVSQAGGDAWWYRYSSAADEGFWSKSDGGPDRFSYKYASGAWFDYPSFGTGYQVGASGLGAAFIGNGAWKDLYNGWRYKYAYGANDGFWATPLTGLSRLSYGYDTGQWYHHDSLGRYTLGQGSQAASVFLGDGLRHNITLAGGDSWWFKYNKGEDKAAWFKSATGNTRFAYSYSTGDWGDYPVFGSTYNLGVEGRSANFIGDGNRHDLGNGWWYAFAYGTDVASWAQTDTSPTRFSYAYNTGKWYHHDGSTDYALGSGQKNAAIFIGNGGIHDVYVYGNTRWLYQYLYASDTSTWALPDTGSTRFSYRYGSGEWLHHDSTGGYLMGSGAPDVLADTAFHSISVNGNEWMYRHDYDYDTEYWREPTTGTERFRYAFGTSRWYQGGYQLGPDGTSVSELMLDGSSHSVGTSDPWWFTYDYGADTGSWAKGQLDPARFSYNYLAATWTDHAPSGSYQLGIAGLNSSFLGDGYDHTVGNGWNYAYTYGSDEATWKRGSTRIFSYDYDGRQWYQWDSYANRYELGSDNWAASDFIGDGNRHDVTLAGGDTWWYSFDSTYTLGRWFRSDTDADKRFDYGYGTAAWRHFGPHSPSGVVLRTGVSADFFGNEQYHGMTTTDPWSYAYDYDNDRALFSRDGGTTMRFAYNYTPGTWMDNAPSGEYQMGAAGLDANFRGDGTARSLGNGWNYLYQYNPEEGLWKRAWDNRTIFSYAYGAGQWYHHDNSNRYALGEDNWAASEFMGDGNRHNVTVGTGNTWWYSYDSVNTLGNWFRSDSDTDKRFGYLYATDVWLHFGPFSSNLVGLRAGVGAGVFFGDELYHGMTTSSPWSYAYDYEDDLGFFSKDGGTSVRFTYNYTPGTWMDNAPSGEYQLGAAGLDAWFRGDGVSRSVGNGWNYVFQYNPEEGLWKRPSDDRTIFSYVYGTGQWYHQPGSSSRHALGEANWAASVFIGDGNRRNITVGTGDTWWYRYDSGTSASYWFRSDNDSDKRFGYVYDATYGTWSHFGPHSPSGGPLSSGFVIGFMGDGLSHSVQNVLDYRYNYTLDEGLWRHNSSYVDRFVYEYDQGQWSHNYNSVRYPLGLAGAAVSEAFWDGSEHLLSIAGDNWYYRYDGGNSRAIYRYDGTSGSQFVYTYGSYGDTGTWGFYESGYVRNFTNTGRAPDVFFGDGAYHDTYSGGAYIRVKYDKSTNRLLVDKTSANSAGLFGWLYYDYASQKWWDYYVTNDSYHLMNGWFLSNFYGSYLLFTKTGVPGSYSFGFSLDPLGNYSDAAYRDYNYGTGMWLLPDEAGAPDLYRP
ncbi:MAG: hypothetical protein HY912_06850 [Desulfomonile tiedjei]|uniref:Uncharacterized protein n=1 Tax=Desulfomonile tiedjei TaxID=2358 RepID=A0A9D6Z2W1_9BACT|nr:hypothetical protein [Desulfomonile tiedjei]